MTAEKVAQVQRLDQVPQGRRQSLAQMALAWILKDGRITSVLIGASSVNQLADSLPSLSNKNFSPEEIGEIEAILNNA